MTNCSQYGHDCQISLEGVVDNRQLEIRLQLSIVMVGAVYTVNRQIFAAKKILALASVAKIKRAKMFLR